MPKAKLAALFGDGQDGLSGVMWLMVDLRSLRGQGASSVEGRGAKGPANRVMIVGSPAVRAMDDSYKRKRCTTRLRPTHDS